MVLSKALVAMQFLQWVTGQYCSIDDVQVHCQPCGLTCNFGRDPCFRCPEQCGRGMQAETCESVCSKRCKDGICEYLNSQLKCSKGCMNGFTGMSCQEFCPQHCKSGSCDQLTSECTSCRDRGNGEDCVTSSPIPPVETDLSSLSSYSSPIGTSNIATRRPVLVCFLMCQECTETVAQYQCDHCGDKEHREICEHMKSSCSRNGTCLRCDPHAAKGCQLMKSGDCSIGPLNKACDPMTENCTLEYIMEHQANICNGGPNRTNEDDEEENPSGQNTLLWWGIGVGVAAAVLVILCVIGIAYRAGVKYGRKKRESTCAVELRDPPCSSDTDNEARDSTTHSYVDIPEINVHHQPNHISAGVQRCGNPQSSLYEALIHSRGKYLSTQ
ncbi:multiple epidermal growth factor-like domains protein 10 [Haliotis rufescens]|uniref:multiple epidermal growth factor-like domains protein 10 n=1 Tax=Haliotis rufescens TaxID=6454 RepID=UPI00201F46E0|nr:multiple epidermal growth factor-like domains protein 10 [Haliotis rufescens]